MLTRAGARSPVRIEDVVILLWLLLGSPVRAVLGPAGDSSAGGASPLGGLLFVAAGLGALVGAILRPPGGSLVEMLTAGGPREPDPHRSGRIPARIFLPVYASFIVLVAIAWVVSDGLARLGISTGEDFFFVVIIVGSILMAVSHRLPSVATPWRRALVMPFILVATWLFDQVVGGLFASIDPGALLAGATAEGSGIVALLFIIAASLPFYALLVFAPRQLAEREGSAVAWAVRYGVFLAGTLGGATWLADLGR